MHLHLQDPNTGCHAVTRKGYHGALQILECFFDCSTKIGTCIYNQKASTEPQVILPSNHEINLLIINDMQVLLRLLLFSRGSRRQVVETAAAIILQVLIRQVSKVGRFYAEILESLRTWVNLLVDAFLFELVGRHDLPPDDLVQIVQDRLEHPFG